MTEKMQKNKQTNTSGKFYIKQKKKEKVISGGFKYNLFLMLIDIYNDKRHEYCIRPEWGNKRLVTSKLAQQYFKLSIK